MAAAAQAHIKLEVGAEQAYLCSGVGFLAQIRAIDVVAILASHPSPQPAPLPPPPIPPPPFPPAPSGSNAATGELEREKQTKSGSELKQRQSLIKSISDKQRRVRGAGW